MFIEEKENQPSVIMLMGNAGQQVDEPMRLNAANSEFPMEGGR